MAREWRALRALGFLGLAALAIGAASADPPDPLEAVQSAARTLNARAREGYAVLCEVQGGLSKSADHQLDVVITVNERYEGLVRGKVMRVAAMEVFRTEEKGAIRSGERWLSLVSVQSGKKLERLFPFSPRLLARALERPARITWVESAAPVEPAGAPDGPGEGGAIGGGGGGNTSVARKSPPSRVRIDLPEEDALRVFSEMQSSGCLPGG
jgi:hypothetical protein